MDLQLRQEHLEAKLEQVFPKVLWLNKLMTFVYRQKKSITGYSRSISVFYKKMKLTLILFKS